jgi:hypothetical protein
MKPNRSHILAAGVVLAMAFTFSCSDDKEGTSSWNCYTRERGIQYEECVKYRDIRDSEAERLKSYCSPLGEVMAAGPCPSHLRCYESIELFGGTQTTCNAL